MNIRLATHADLPALHDLIPLSARALSRPFYTDAQAAAAIEFVFGPDTQLINDRTYYMAEAHGGTIIGCGGWSRRATLCGGDQYADRADTLLDPEYDAARIRAFFVHPYYARQGVGTRLLQTCESAAYDAGFRSLTLIATLPGEPLYAAFGYAAVERYIDTLPDGTTLTFVRMSKTFS